MNSKPQTIVLVGCSAKKLPAAAAARYLYTGALFKKSAAYAEARGFKWFVLSAEHGLVEPDRVIKPYNAALYEKTVRQRARWANSVLRDLCTRITPDDKIIILAGELYAKHLIAPLMMTGCTVTRPLRGLGIGEQLSVLKAWNENSDAAI